MRAQRALAITFDASLAAVLLEAVGSSPEVLEPDRLGCLEHLYELVLVDGAGDAAAVCRAVRASDTEAAILAILPLGNVAERVAVLEAGADDCLARPFDVRELIARVRALLRSRDEPRPPRLAYADVAYDTARQQVTRAGRDLELTRTEAALLELFLRNPRQVLPRDLIAERVWGRGSREVSNLLDVYVGYLRRKLEQRGEPRLIQTVRGVGYMLENSTTTRGLM